MKDGFGEAVVACDMPEPCKCPSLGRCQKRFLRTHKGVDLAPHPVVGLVLQVGNAEKFPQALGFEGLDPILRVSKQLSQMRTSFHPSQEMLLPEVKGAVSV